MAPAAARRRASLAPARAALALLVMLPGTVAAREVSGRQVLQAIEAGKKFLLVSQKPDGTWPGVGSYPGGTTAIATLALANTGLTPRDRPMQTALEAVARMPNRQTYVVSLKAQALAAADPGAYQAEIRAAAAWLVKAQRPSGMWGYTAQGLQADFSNTQFALLGLHEAARAGAVVPALVWRRAESAWRQSQRADGGFGYREGGGPSTGSMTAAGIASLYITGNELAVPLATDRAAPCCGRYAGYLPISRGLAWLGRNFSAARNPGGAQWYYYYLYGLERAGILSGLQHIGRHDWYREGAAELVSRQHPSGAWSEFETVSDTSFALLFLAKGHRPVLVQKLKWSADRRWNTARNDLAHLVGFIGDRIGGRPVGWNAVDLDADLRDWQAAPILYVSGREFPALEPEAAARVRAYVEEGGTLLVEATCSQQTTRDGFSAFVRQAFEGQDLERLGADHEVFSAPYRLDGRAIELHGLDVGCRTAVFFSPTDLACQWERADVTGADRTAFELGANIAVYATGAEALPDRLDRPRPAVPASMPSTQPSPRAVWLAQLVHGGDWRPFPRAVANLADELSAHLGVDMVRQAEPLAATDARLADHPILCLTGGRPFALAAEEIAALRRHLERGGFLWADACCGRQPFDEAFRRFAAQLFPEAPLQRLPQEHPIIAGAPGFPLPRIAYLPAVLKEQPDLREVRLEGIDFGGRTVLVYSPFGLGCGLSGGACLGCRGVASEDARKLAANIILYALSY